MTQAALRLQSLRFARACRHAGLTPWVAVALLAAGALVAAGLAYARLSTFTPPVLTVAAIATGAYLVAPSRATWREHVLGHGAARRWRYGEAGAVTVLATALLLVLRAPVYLLALLPVNALLAWRPALGRGVGGGGVRRLLARGAPFGKTPYAFVAGLRRTWPAYAFLGAILAQAAYISNGRLAVVAAVLWMLVPAGFYSETEPEYLLRMDVRAAGDFLRDKCAVGLRQHATLSLLPLAVTLLRFPAYWPWLLLGYVYAAVVLVAAIGLAYRAYPARAGLGESLLFAAAAVLPPALLAYAYWAHRTARARLHRYLP